MGALGINLREGGDYYGYSLSLGSAEMPLLQITNAYRALANGGRLSPTARCPGTAPVFRAALDPGASFIVSDILADTHARAPTFGSDSLLATRFWSAVKTGTSKDARQLGRGLQPALHCVGVWVGNASSAAMWDVSGTSGAAPVWATLMQTLHGARGATTRSRPRRRRASSHSAWPLATSIEAARSGWFLKGTEQALFATDSKAPSAGATDARGRKPSKNQPAAHANAGDAVPARITAPQDGTILALDPDIPPARQRLTPAPKRAAPQPAPCAGGSASAKSAEASAPNGCPGRAATSYSCATRKGACWRSAAWKCAAPRPSQERGRAELRQLAPRHRFSLRGALTWALVGLQRFLRQRWKLSVQKHIHRRLSDGSRPSRRGRQQSRGRAMCPDAELLRWCGFC